MMHGPGGLGKPHILPLCLKEGSMQRSHKIKYLPLPSATKGDTCKEMGLNTGTGSVCVVIKSSHNFKDQ